MSGPAVGSTSLRGGAPEYHPLFIHRTRAMSTAAWRACANPPPFPPKPHPPPPAPEDDLTGLDCPQFTHLCAPNPRHSTPFCDADEDCYGDVDCCGDLSGWPVCGGTKACGAGTGCCVSATISAGTPSPPKPPPLLAPRPLPPPCPPSSPLPPGVPWDAGESTPFGDWELTLEPFSGPLGAGNGDALRLVLRGNQRGYLTRRGIAQYEHLRLLGKTLRWTVDVSQVGCGCNAALYLVGMGQPWGSESRYCDIQLDDPRRCIEIDLFV